jgi:multicomponent Na+:H+ antiporter subunit E
MRSTRALRAIGAAGALVVVWVLSWGEVSVGNVVSGVAVAGALLVAFPLGDVPHVDHRLHPVAVVRLAAVFLAELVLSSLAVARDIVRGPAAVRTGIVSCPLRVEAGGLITFLANLIALSPGTMPIDVTLDPPVLHVHVLRLRDPDEVRAHVARFEELAVAALGGPEALAAVRAKAVPT